MDKPKHIILKKQSNLIKFNKSKAKLITKNPTCSSLSDEDALEKIMEFYLDKNA